MADDVRHRGAWRAGGVCLSIPTSPGVTDGNSAAGESPVSSRLRVKAPHRRSEPCRQNSPVANPGPGDLTSHLTAATTVGRPGADPARVRSKRVAVRPIAAPFIEQGVASPRQRIPCRGRLLQTRPLRPHPGGRPLRARHDATPPRPRPRPDRGGRRELARLGCWSPYWHLRRRCPAHGVRQPLHGLGQLRGKKWGRQEGDTEGDAGGGNCPGYRPDPAPCMCTGQAPFPVAVTGRTLFVQGRVWLEGKVIGFCRGVTDRRGRKRAALRQPAEG